MGLFDSETRKAILDRRIQLASQRKYWAIAIIIVAAGIFFSSAFNIIFSAVGMFFKAISLTIYGAALIIKTIFDVIIWGIKKLFGLKSGQ